MEYIRSSGNVGIAKDHRRISCITMTKMLGIAVGIVKSFGIDFGSFGNAGIAVGIVKLFGIECKSCGNAGIDGDRDS